MGTSLSKLEANIEAQKKKLEQLRALKQKMEAQEKTRQQTLERKEDTRRKILAGALLLELMGKDAELQQQMLGKLSGFLTRPDDRKLFGLPGGAS